MFAKMPPVRPGSQVKLHLQIQFADGMEVLSTFGEEAIALTIGDGTLAPGLEELLMGLQAGADECFATDGSRLYGPRDKSKIHWIGRSDFPPDMDLSPSQLVAFDAPGGQKIAGLLLNIEKNRVQVDFNHPLAGHSLQVRARIISVSEPTGL
jgi:FKBP-type peptidyl-prolyl cis-trans isomerase SlpA